MRPCAVDGCEEAHYSRGFCRLHYRRWRSQGDPLRVGNGRGLTAIEKFTRRYRVDATSGCWMWTAGTNDGGYGRFVPSRAEGTCAAHRWSYEHFVGPIPAGMTIDHVKDRGCTSRLCVNPAHLEAVTLAVNLMRSPAAPSTRNAAKSHCPRGHPYDVTYTSPAGRPYRGCLRCKVASQRSYLERKAGR